MSGESCSAINSVDEATVGFSKLSLTSQRADASIERAPTIGINKPTATSPANFLQTQRSQQMSHPVQSAFCGDSTAVTTTTHTPLIINAQCAEGAEALRRASAPADVLAAAAAAATFPTCSTQAASASGCEAEYVGRGDEAQEQLDELTEYFEHFVNIETKMSDLAQSMYA